VRLVVQVFDQLGEGPVWSAAEGRLYWFDIRGRRLSWHEPVTASVGAIDLPMRASAAAVRAGGGLLMATENGLFHLDTRTGSVTERQAFTFEAGFRTNDGKVDPHGRFWWSIMDDNGGMRPGALFRTDPDGRSERMLGGVHIPNTVSFSPDGARLYLADSLRQTLYVHEVEDLSKVVEFANTRGQPGTPDGSAVDVEGGLWNAQWGAARIVRYRPDGSVDRVVEMPVDQPTSCAFGGPDLATLYVTSAREGLTDAALGRQAAAGGLFAFAPGVRGQPIPTFEG
jgi:sugar lactone lactonase YvrE